MSTFNISQKIGTGGAFTKTNNGATTILTTTVGQYAKVRIQGYMFRNSGVGTSTLTVSVGGVTIRSISVSGTGDAKSLHTSRNPDSSGSETGVEFMDILVPPSSNLVLTASLVSVTTLDVSGTYVFIENTL